MKFLKATPLFTSVELPDIYTAYREEYATLRNIDDAKAQIATLEERFAKDLMARTLDNIQIQLETNESLWIVMHGDWAVNLSKHTGTNVFNISGFIKLLGGLPKFTYFVVMNDDRTDSVTLRMYPTRLGLMAIHQTKEYPPTTELEFKL